MKCYSLIDCSDYFSIGIYTSLDNLYTVLKKLATQSIEDWDWSKEEIKKWYKIKEVHLDSEPLECSEFSTYGKEIKIDWDKIF